MYEEARHEPLIKADWNEERVHAEIDRIVRDTHAHFHPQKLWPMHPLDRFAEKLPESLQMLYFGAAGVIWALDYLSRLISTGGKLDLTTNLNQLADQNRLEMNLSQQESSSFWMGDVGILLTAHKLSPSEQIADELARLIAANIRNPTREIMWGAPGTMLAALFLWERTADPRWKELFLNSVDELWKQWEPVPEIGCYLWTQDLYGRSLRYLGAGHGFAATARVLIRGHHLLNGPRRNELFSRICDVLVATVEEDADCANWPAAWFPMSQGRKMLVQHCHGAPGMITCLADIPVGLNARFDELLQKGGELIWRAGPLTKGPSLCHGTAGNGYAFLKLYRRTGDAKWLDRARAFAMYAIVQSERHGKEYGQRRYSLWTGDLGLAVYLWDCIKGEAKFPTMDIF